MDPFIYVTSCFSGYTKAINILDIANYQKVSQDLTYIDYYACDVENGNNFKIERIETRESFDSIRHQITEVLHQSQTLFEARNRR